MEKMATTADQGQQQQQSSGTTSHNGTPTRLKKIYGPTFI